MNSLKKFINKKRANQHFKNSGPGQRLSDNAGAGTSGGSSAPVGVQADRNVQAEALMKRLNQNQPMSAAEASRKKIQMQAKKQLEEERRQMEEMNISNDNRETPKPEPPQELDHAAILPGVLFYSDLLGEQHARPKPQLIKDMKQYLLEQIAESDDEDKISGAVLMIHTLNKRETRDIAIETICKLVNNILEKPDDEKVRKIRITNEKIIEKIINPPGARAFLEAIGFSEQQIRDESTGQTVPWLVYTNPEQNHLCEALAELKTGEPIPIRVSRSLEIFQLKPGQEVRAPKVPDGFYNLTTAEIKAEQANKTKEMEKMLTLRTKEMRERDAKLTNNKYRYTAIRVRLPGNFAVQGTFSVHEPFSAVREFVAGTLSPAVAASEFRLHDRIQQHVDDESVSLLELGLVPSAYLHLTFMENFDDSVEILAEEHVGLIHELED